MRSHPNRRGIHPILDADAIHLWTFDESLATGGLVDKVDGGEALTQSGNPALGDSLICGSRVFASSDRFSGSTTGADRDDLIGDRTVDVCFKLANSFSTTGTIVAYYAAVESPESNILVWLEIDANRKLNILWEYSGGTNENYTFDYEFLLNKWYQISVVYDVGATYTDVYLYVFGGLVDSNIGTKINATSTGTPIQTWIVGSQIGGTNQFVGEIGSIRISKKVRTAAECEETARRALGMTSEFKTLAKVEVENANSTLVDLSDLGGVNWIDGIEFADDLDSQVATLDVRLKRDSYDLSLAKLNDNKMNRYPLESESSPGPDDTTSGDLLDIGRQIVFYVARIPVDVDVVSTDWVKKFDGFIERVNWGNGDDVSITARDKGSKLLRGYVESDATSYPKTAGSCSPIEGNTYGPVETAIQDILSDANTNSWVDSLITLYSLSGTSGTPFQSADSPLWCVKQDKVDRQPILTTLNGYASQIGWICRYKWNHSIGDFALTLYEPERTQTYPNFIVENRDVLNISRAEIDLTNIRNVGRIYFESIEEVTSPTYAGDRGGPDGNDPANGTIAWVQAHSDGASGAITDGSGAVDPSSSVGKYGRQYFEICEGGASNIDTVAEAEKLLVAMLRDLREPTVQFDVETFVYPEIELNDVLRIRANGVHFSADKDLAVCGIKYSFGDDGATSSIALRGAPSSGTKEHLAKEVRTSGALPPVSGKDSILSRRSSRWKLAGKQALMDRSSMLGGGRFSTVKNPGFNELTYGPSVPFDGWSVTGGSWDSDVDKDSTQQNTGDFCLYLATASAVVKSDWIPVVGGNWYQFDVDYKLDSTGSGNSFGAYVEWYTTKTGSLLSTGTIISAGTATSYTRVRTPLAANASAKWARIRLQRAASAPIKKVYVDSVEVTQIRPGILVGMSANQTGLSQKARNLVAFDQPDHVYGSGIYVATSGNYYFQVPFDGVYRIRAKSRVSGGALSWSSLIIRKSTGGTYSDWIYGPRASTLQGLVTNTATCDVDSGNQFLTAGHRYRIAQWFDVVTAGSGQILSGLEKTFFDVRFISYDMY